MFPGKTRPVPSKGALRALYQLAYISSGTAVGIAALCAEEKRRRAQILQKVADNAKRIRGSSRYVGNVAHERPKGARTEELPSRVEQGYEQLMEKDWKRRRRRREDSVGDGHGSSKVKEERRQQRHQRSSDGAKGPRIHKYSEYPPPSQLFRHVESRATPLPPGAVQPTQTRKPKVDTSKVAAFLQSRRSEPPSEDLYLRSHRTIEDNIHELSNLPPKSITSSDKAEIASQLFAVATEKGMFSYVQDTYDWKNKNNRFTEHDMTLLIESLPLLKQRVDHLELVHFLTDVLQSRSLRNFRPQARLSFGMTIAVDALDWDLENRFQGVRHLMRPTLQGNDPSVVQKAFEQHCDQLIGLGKSDRARLLIYVGGKLPRALNDFNVLLDRVFWSALATNDLQCCCRILKSKLRSYGDDRGGIQRDTFVYFLEPFASACREQNQYRVLSGIVEDDYRIVNLRGGEAVLRALAPDLSTSAKTALAIATTFLHSFPVELFDELHQQIPIVSRGPVEEARTVTKIAESWSATLNFDAVSVEYQSCVNFAIRVGNDDARLRCDLAMVKVCNQANRPDRALEILSQLAKDKSTSGECSSYIAAVLARHAKQNAWTELDKFLEVVETAKIQLMTGDSSATNVNTTIHFYSLKHTALETKKFVACLTDRFGFRLNKASHLLMLKVFVLHGELEMLSQWLHEHKTDGCGFGPDVQTAASLLTTYYREMRPSHSSMMRYCRKLMPAFNYESEPFIALVRETLDYDLRHSVVSLKARENLEKLNNYQGRGIPHPVRWHKLHQAVDPQVTYGDPLSSTAEVLDSQASPQSSSNGPDEGSCLSNMQANQSAGESPNTYQPFEWQIALSHVDDVAQDVARSAGPQDNELGDEDSAARAKLDTLSARDSTHAKDREGNLRYITECTDHPKSAPSTGPHELESRDTDALTPAESELFLESDFACTEDQSDPETFSGTADTGNSRDMIHSAHGSPSNDGTASNLEAVDVATRRELEGSNNSDEGQEAPATELDSVQKQIDQSELIRTMDSLYGDEHDVHKAAVLTDTDPTDTLSLRDNINYQTKSVFDGEADQVEDVLSSDIPATDSEKRRLFRELMTKFSLRQYGAVLDLYHANIYPSGLPVSSRVLEVAVEASLRLHGHDSTDAERILNRARDAGMNVDSAMKHLMIHDIWRLDSAERRNANTLRLKVIEYYRFHAEKKLQVSHYLGVTAADVLIRHNRAAHGVNLLAAIYRSEWTDQDKLDIVAMTVWVKGYHGLRNEFRNGVEGLVWVLNTVFKDNIRINRDFVVTVKAAFRDFGMPDWSNPAQRKRLLASASVTGVPRMLLMLYRRCIVQWNRQQDETFQQGWKLVQIIRDYVLQEKGSVNPGLAISSTQQVREEEPPVDSDSISSKDGSDSAELLRSSTAQDLSRAEVQEQDLKDIDQELPDEVKARVEAPGLEMGVKSTKPRIRVSTLAEHEDRQLRRAVKCGSVRPRRVQSSKGGRA